MDHSAALTEAIRWGASFHGQNIGSQVFGDLGQHFPAGTPWCAEFVRDILLHAGIKTPSEWYSVQAIHDWANRVGLLVRGLNNVHPGDVVGIDSLHTGIVQSVHGNVITTVSGNSWSMNHTVQVQQLHNYWNWHVNMAPVIQGHMTIVHAAVASAAHVTAVHGSGVAHLHLAAMLHGAAVLSALHLALPLAAVLALFNSEPDAQEALDGNYGRVDLIFKDRHLKPRYL